MLTIGEPDAFPTKIICKKITVSTKIKFNTKLDLVDCDCTLPAFSVAKSSTY